MSVTVHTTSRTSGVVRPGRPPRPPGAASAPAAPRCARAARRARPAAPARSPAVTGMLGSGQQRRSASPAARATIERGRVEARDEHVVGSSRPSRRRSSSAIEQPRARRRVGRRSPAGGGRSSPRARPGPPRRRPASPRSIGRSEGRRVASTTTRRSSASRRALPARPVSTGSCTQTSCPSRRASDVELDAVRTGRQGGADRFAACSPGPGRRLPRCPRPARTHPGKASPAHGRGRAGRDRVRLFR